MVSNVDLFKKMENILYNLSKTKLEIENMKLDLQLLEEEYEGVGAISYDEKSGKTNKFNSVVENEMLRREKAIELKKREIRVKEIKIKKIENAINMLTEKERQIIILKYFEKCTNKIIAAKIDREENYISTLKRNIINKLVDIIFYY